MMNKPEANRKRLSSDRPLNNPSNDKLGYAPFAKLLADSICDLAPNDGFVMALYGPWGSGKSTVLEFLEFYLEQLPAERRPIVVRFNPWWFSGYEDISRRFLTQLQSTLSTRKALADSLINSLGRFTKALSESPLPYATYIKPIRFLLDLLGSKSSDFPSLKKSISDQLKEAKKHIVVIIDDIDRLTSEEIRQLFRSVKAIGDFPYITYLMAFDKDVVTTALEAVQGTPGKQYLEKIVQAPFELPIPDKESLRRLFTEQLDEILSGTPEVPFDTDHWSKVYLEGLETYIKTPRDIVVLINTLAVTYSAVSGEVNPVDFIAVEALRVFQPDVYDIIRRNPSLFTSRTDLGTYGQRPEDQRAFHDAWLSQHDSMAQERLKTFLIHLFPTLESVWTLRNYPEGIDGVWRRDLRVCAEDIFPIYFRMALPQGAISNAEMLAFLAVSADEQAIRTKLRTLATEKRPDGITRIRPVLDRLQDYTRSMVTADQARSIIAALIIEGDNLLVPGDEPNTILSFGTEVSVSRVIYQLLHVLGEKERFEVFNSAIDRSASIYTVVNEVALLERYGGEPPSADDELMSEPHLNQLREQALQKIKNVAAEGRLMDSPQLLMYLFRWRDWGDIDGARAWVSQQTNSDIGMLEFLTKTKSKITTAGGNELGTRVHYEVNLQHIEPFVDVQELAARARNILEAPGDLSDEHNLTLAELINRVEMQEISA